MIIFLFIPGIVLLIMASSRYKYSSYTALFAICCISLHGIADVVATVYFIKPYREFFSRILGIISQKMSLSQNVSAIEHTVPNGGIFLIFSQKVEVFELIQDQQSDFIIFQCS